MARIDRFEQIEAWIKARELTKAIYGISRHGEFARDFALRDQIRRAAISIMLNIAEGFERDGNSEFRQHLSIAKASAAEVQSGLYIALDAELIDATEFDQLYQLAQDTKNLIAGFIRYLNKTPLKGRKYQ